MCSVRSVKKESLNDLPILTDYVTAVVAGVDGFDVFPDGSDADAKTAAKEVGDNLRKAGKTVAVRFRAAEVAQAAVFEESLNAVAAAVPMKVDIDVLLRVW